MTQKRASTPTTQVQDALLVALAQKAGDGHEENGWSFNTFLYLTKALRDADAALRQRDLEFDQERDRRNTEVMAANDRRITEVALEREKALGIKETADENALKLAREIQTYKDEKANDLRSQIERERGSYATKDDLTKAMEKIEVQLRPVLEFISRTSGKTAGMSLSWGWMIAGLTLLVAVVSAVAAVALVNHQAIQAVAK